jgi:predicted dinucleotide-binding enzyme
MGAMRIGIIGAGDVGAALGRDWWAREMLGASVCAIPAQRNTRRLPESVRCCGLPRRPPG